MEYLELDNIIMMYRNDEWTKTGVNECNLTVYFQNADDYTAHIRIKDKKPKSAMEKWGSVMASAGLLVGKAGLALAGGFIKGKVYPYSVRSIQKEYDNLKWEIAYARGHSYEGTGNEEIIFRFTRSNVFFEDVIRIVDTYSSTSYCFYSTQEKLNEWKAFFGQN